MAKPTKAQITRRREEVQMLLIDGWSARRIREELSKKHRCSPRSIAEDIRLINKEWEAAADVNKKQARNKYLDRLEHMFETALSSDNLKQALDIQKEINRLSGLYNNDEAAQELPKFISIKSKDDKPADKIIDTETGEEINVQ